MERFLNSNKDSSEFFFFGKSIITCETHNSSNIWDFSKTKSKNFYLHCQEILNKILNTANSKYKFSFPDNFIDNYQNFEKDGKYFIPSRCIFKSEDEDRRVTSLNYRWLQLQDSLFSR